MSMNLQMGSVKTFGVWNSTVLNCEEGVNFDGRHQWISPENFAVCFMLSILIASSVS